MSMLGLGCHYCGKWKKAYHSLNATTVEFVPQWLCVRYGLVVRIPGSHPGGPGSIPGNGKSFCKVHDAKKRKNNISANTQNAKSEQSDARNCNDKMEVFLYEDTQKTPFRSRILTSYHWTGSHWTFLRRFLKITEKVELRHATWDWLR